MKRTPLEILALSIAAVALIVIVLSFSHIFGIGILSRLFPEIGEPGQISFYPRFMIFITLILPAFILFSFLYVISVPLRYVLARKRHSGYRTEIILIAYSFTFTALTLLSLEESIQYSEHLRDLLTLTSSVLALLSLIPLMTAIIYRYFIDEKPQRLRDYIESTFLVLLLLGMMAAAIFFLNKFVHEFFP